VTAAGGIGAFMIVGRICSQDGEEIAVSIGEPAENDGIILYLKYGDGIYYTKHLTKEEANKLAFVV
jgi:hypothetical protein